MWYPKNKRQKTWYGRHFIKISPEKHLLCLMFSQEEQHPTELTSTRLATAEAVERGDKHSTDWQLYWVSSGQSVSQTRRRPHAEQFTEAQREKREYKKPADRSKAEFDTSHWQYQDKCSENWKRKLNCGALSLTSNWDSSHYENLTCIPINATLISPSVTLLLPISFSRLFNELPKKNRELGAIQDFATAVCLLLQISWM